MVSVSHSQMCLGLVLKMCMHIGDRVLAAIWPCGDNVDAPRLALAARGRVSYSVGSLFLVGVYIRYVEVLPNTRGFTGQVLHLVQFSSHLDR